MGAVMQRGLIAAAVAYGALVFGNGADRLTETSQQWGRIVPAPFRAKADVAAAVDALTRHDAAGAQAYGKRAVEASPMDRTAVGVTAYARYLADDADAADAAFRVSGQLGWRDVPTQLYWYQVGLQSNDYQLAAQRADAILRANPEYPGIQALLQPLEASPQGREALLARLVERPGWLGNYAFPAPDAKRDAMLARSAVLGALARRGIALGCKTVSAFAFQLADSGLRGAARGLWSDHCSRQASNAVPDDPQFQRLAPERASPFDWKSYGAGSVGITTAMQPDGQYAAVVSNASAFVSPLVSQFVDLPAGRYRARLTVGDPARARGRIFATLSCGPTPVRSPVPGEGLVDQGQELVSTGCERQLFTLWMKPNPEDVVMRRITIEPLR